MEFDQAFAGNGDWNFPSPGPTPTSQSFNQAVQTPKTATFPSHFQDAFTTPQMPGYSTPQQPQYQSMTPMQRPQSSSDVLRSNFYASVQATGTPGMQPPTQATYHAQMISPVHDTGYQVPYQQHVMPQASFDSSQMQTPPPTRGTSAKKPLQPAQIAFGTPSTIATRRFLTPQQAMPQPGPSLGPQTPMQYPQLQFSPEVYQFANLGPASAPVMPQTQLLWDQMRSPTAYAQQSPLEDPFAPQIRQAAQWAPLAPSPQQTLPAQMSFDTPVMASFAVQPPHPRPASATQVSSAFTPIAAAPAATSASLDPSLIYSSPLRPIVRSSSRASKGRPEPQTQTKRKDSAANSKASTASISPVETAPAITGPGLRRSNTTGTARPRTAQSTTSLPEALSRSNSITQVPRTASPLKRAGRTPLGAISEYKPRQRPSVVLTVDENGLARTETRRVEPSPTRSIRERYPGLFDSDSSDDESETSEQAPSRSASFTFAKGEERRSKAARLDPPVENLEGLSIPRSSSSASMKGVTPSRAAIAAAAQLRRQSSTRKSSRTSATKRNPMTSSTSSLIDSCPMGMSDEHQQASQGAGIESEDGFPQPLIAPKARNKARGQTDLEAHNRRWSMMSFEQQGGIPGNPYQQPGQLSYGHPYQRATPLIRCICGATHDQGQPLIQCTSCTQWLHTACVGLDGYAIPPAYTCFLCTKPASGLR